MTPAVGENSLINSFLFNNHVHPLSISYTTDANKIHHQESLKHSFDLSNESYIRDDSEDVILMKETDSSVIQQKVNKKHASVQN